MPHSSTTEDVYEAISIRTAISSVIANAFDSKAPAAVAQTPTPLKPHTLTIEDVSKSTAMRATVSAVAVAFDRVADEKAAATTARTSSKADMSKTKPAAAPTTTTTTTTTTATTTTSAPGVTTAASRAAPTAEEDAAAIKIQCFLKQSVARKALSEKKSAAMFAEENRVKNEKGDSHIDQEEEEEEEEEATQKDSPAKRNSTNNKSSSSSSDAKNASATSSPSKKAADIRLVPKPPAVAKSQTSGSGNNNVTTDSPSKTAHSSSSAAVSPNSSARNQNAEGGGGKDAVAVDAQQQHSPGSRSTSSIANSSRSSTRSPRREPGGPSVGLAQHDPRYKPAAFDYASISNLERREAAANRVYMQKHLDDIYAEDKKKVRDEQFESQKKGGAAAVSTLLLPAHKRRIDDSPPAKSARVPVAERREKGFLTDDEKLQRAEITAHVSKIEAIMGSDRKTNPVLSAAPNAESARQRDKIIEKQKERAKKSATSTPQSSPLAITDGNHGDDGNGGALTASHPDDNKEGAVVVAHRQPQPPQKPKPPPPASGGANNKANKGPLPALTPRDRERNWEIARENDRLRRFIAREVAPTVPTTQECIRWENENREHKKRINKVPAPPPQQPSPQSNAGKKKGEDDDEDARNDRKRDANNGGSEGAVVEVKPVPRIFVRQREREERARQEAQTARGVSSADDATAKANNRYANQNYLVASTASQSALVSPRALAAYADHNQNGMGQGGKGKHNRKGGEGDFATKEMGWNNDVATHSIFLGKLRDYTNPLFKDYEGNETKRTGKLSPRVYTEEERQEAARLQQERWLQQQSDNTSKVPKLPPITMKNNNNGNADKNAAANNKRDEKDKKNLPPISYAALPPKPADEEKQKRRQEDASKPKAAKTNINFSELKKSKKAPAVVQANRGHYRPESDLTPTPVMSRQTQVKAARDHQDAKAKGQDSHAASPAEAEDDYASDHEAMSAAESPRSEHSSAPHSSRASSRRSSRASSRSSHASSRSRSRSSSRAPSSTRSVSH